MSRRLTVVFDASPLAAEPPTGVTRSFALTLAAYAETAPHRCVVLWARDRTPPDWLPSSVDVIEVRAGPTARQQHLPALLRRLAADLLHSPVAAIPLRAPCAVVATVHDVPWLAAARFPELRDEPGCSWRHRLALRLAARRAQALLVPSRSTANAVRTACGPAVDDRLWLARHGIPATTDAAPIERHGPLLVIGDDRARKNGRRIREAHRRARTTEPSLPPLRQIGPGFEFVSEADKSELLRSCRALVHVALHEGFGLPVLEAMAAGTPVLCSDIAALREVGGHAVLAVAPTDCDAIAAAMVRIHRDAPLRRRLAQRGRQRARRQTPARAAAAWRRAHRAALAQNSLQPLLTTP